MEHVCHVLGVSERRACCVLGQPRSTQRHRVAVCEGEARLVARIVELAKRYGRYGYRRITALLRREGWSVNHKKVERIWRQEGLRVPRKQPKRGRLWWNDGSCVRKRAEHRDHVWSYDFVFDRTHDGRPLRMLTMVDEYTRECLTIDVARQYRSEQVLDRLAELFVERGVPTYLRSDNASILRKCDQSWLLRDVLRRRIHGEGRAGVDGAGQREDVVHRTRKSLG